MSKTASPAFTRTFKWDIKKIVDKTQINTASGDAIFNYTVSVTHDAGTDSGWQVKGTITVANPNSFTVTGVNVSDAVTDGGSCSVTNGTNVSVPANGSAQLSYTCTFSSNPGSGTNTATATWASIGSPNTSGTGSATFTFGGPTSTADNTVSITDTLGGTLGTVNSSDVSPTPFTYSHTFSGDPAGTCKTHDNTATFTTNTTGTTGSASQSVKVCVGADLTVTKTATPSFTRTFTWGITKSVDKTQINIASGGTATFNYTVSVTHDSGTDAKWQDTGTITVTNPNDWEDIVANVADSNDDGGTCTVTGGTAVSIPAGKSVTLIYTCTYATQPTYNSKATDTATATWSASTYSTPSGSAQGTATFTFNDGTKDNPTIVDDSVAVNDSLGGSLGTVSSSDPSPKTFTYSHGFSGDPAGTCTPHNNTATFTTNSTGTTGSASQSVKVCVGADLTVSKTATPSFTRTYNWKISKSVDRSTITSSGSSVTFKYTVDASETGFTDSGWQAAGAITVTNPNDWEAITANVTDTIDNNGSCTVTGGTAVTIPAGNSVKLNYTCTYSSQPSPTSGTNTATAAWNSSTYFTPDGSSSGTASYAFTSPTTRVNQSITVTDTVNGPLGSLTATDTSPLATQTFTYSRMVNVPAAGCQSYSNTATIKETGQTASQTVTVCRAGIVTDSALCTFDFDTSAPGSQLHLLYTPDTSSMPNYKLNASNPGQFYYNLFYAGGGNTTVTITLPYPWVTQGATPIHVYDGTKTTTSTITDANGNTQSCFSPGTPLAGSSNSVSLSGYSSQSFGSTTTVTVNLPNLPVGLWYINIHLDYGLKGTTAWSKGGVSGNDAISNLTPALPTIPDKQSYAFSDTGGGSATVQSENVFKKNPGIGGFVQHNTGNLDMVSNAGLQIYDNTGKLVATVSTDQDGWYMWSYKYTGSPTPFTVKLPAYNQSQTMTLKSNGFLVASFTVP